VDVPGYLRQAPRTAVIAICAAAIALPPALGNLGGLAFKRTFVGEIAAVNKVCAGIPKGVSVLIIDSNMYQKFGGPVRNTCDVPVAGAQTTLPGGIFPDYGNTIEPATIVAAIRSIENSGHTPLVLAATPTEFAPAAKTFGKGTVKLLLDQTTQDDEHIYFGTPQSTVTERFTVYSWEPAK
jgi:hypothetical protein